MKPYHQFKACWAIAKADFLALNKSPSTLIYNLLFPCVFIVVLGFMSNVNVQFDAALTYTQEQKNVVDNIKKIPNIHFIDNQDNLTIDKKLKQGKWVAWLNITTDSTQQTHIHITTSTASADQFFIFESILKSALFNINTLPSSTRQPVIIHKSVVVGRPFKRIDFLLPGMLGFSLLSSGLFGVAFSFFALRQNLVFKRFFCAPINKLTILIGQLASRIVFQILNSIILIAFGYYFFDFTLMHGWVTAVNMLLLSLLGILTFMSFGFFISGVAKNESTIPAFANMISLPQWLLGGVFFSNEYFPEWLRKVASFLPLTRLNDAMKKVAFEGLGFGDITWDIVVILCWACIGIFAAKKFFRWV